MDPIKIRQRIEALTGSTLQTLTLKRHFDIVDVTRNVVMVKPRSGSGQLRRVDRERIERMASLSIPEERLRQAIVEHYPETRNSSYMAAIVSEITKRCVLE
jgi:hypothetical protein